MTEDPETRRPGEALAAPLRRAEDASGLEGPCRDVELMRRVELGLLRLPTRRSPPEE